MRRNDNTLVYIYKRFMDNLLLSGSLIWNQGIYLLRKELVNFISQRIKYLSVHQII